MSRTGSWHFLALLLLKRHLTPQPRHVWERMQPNRKSFTDEILMGDMEEEPSISQLIIGRFNGIHYLLLKDPAEESGS